MLVNSVDLSDHENSVTYEEGINGQPAAAMTEVQDYEMPGTIKISDIQVEFYQDYAASKVYQTIHPLVTARSTFNISVKADTGANATTNPNFTIPVFVRSFQVFAGSRGDRHMTRVVFAPAGAQTVATS